MKIVNFGYHHINKTSTLYLFFGTDLGAHFYVSFMNIPSNQVDATYEKLKELQQYSHIYPFLDVHVDDLDEEVYRLIFEDGLNGLLCGLTERESATFGGRVLRGVNHGFAGVVDVTKFISKIHSSLLVTLDDKPIEEVRNYISCLNNYMDAREAAVPQKMAVDP